MLGHRIMTLGHIVSSTKLNVNPLKKKKRFDGEEILNKNGLQMVKTIAKSFTVKKPHFYLETTPPNDLFDPTRLA